MCSCLSLRIAETWDYAEYMLHAQEYSQPLIQEALAGGRCKPEGILGEILESTRGEAPN